MRGVSAFEPHAHGLGPVSATMRAGGTKPRWGSVPLAPVIQGGSFLVHPPQCYGGRATLGWRTESRWDSRRGCDGVRRHVPVDADTSSQAFSLSSLRSFVAK